jgi:hypothetical protein
MVRAFNNEGGTAFSNIINITGIEDPGFLLITKAEEGDTLQSIAEEHGVTVGELLAQNPNLNADSALSPSDEISIHISPTQSTSIPLNSSKVALQIRNPNFQFTNNGMEFILPPTGPSPTIQVTVSVQCDINISDHPPMKVDSN